MGTFAEEDGGDGDDDERVDKPYYEAEDVRTASFLF